MTIEIQVDGIRYSQFVSASVNFRLDALSDSFQFQATSEEGKPLPFKGGEACVVVVDGEKVLTGNIEIVEANYSAREHSISISGRDKTGDVVDSTLDSISDIRAPISLKSIIQKVLDQIGLSSSISVIDNVNPDDFNPAEDIASPDPGQGAFQFLEKYSRKRQTLLSSDSNGNIVITDSSGENIDSRIRHVVGGSENNVIKGNVSYDTTGRYNLYKLSSALNMVALNVAAFIPIGDIVSQKGSVSDEDIRAGRQLILLSEDSFSNEQNKDRAEWELNIRKARGAVYSVVVDGFRGTNGDLWEINKIVSVIDDFAGINSRMLVNTVSFSFDLDGGSTTTLGLIDKDAYTLKVSEPTKEVKGIGLFG